MIVYAHLTDPIDALIKWLEADLLKRPLTDAECVRLGELVGDAVTAHEPVLRALALVNEARNRDN